MRCLALLAFFFMVISCKQSGLYSKLSGTDSLVIQFNQPQTNTIIKTVNTTERSAINRLSDFADGKKSELYKCGYDGNMIFFEKGQKRADISFHYMEASCRHFVFDENGTLKATKMSDEAADFLKSLAEGKTSY